MLSQFRHLACLVTMAACASFATAGHPDANVLSIPGLQRGTSAEIKISGARLGDANALLFYSPGLSASNIVKVDANNITATITAEPTVLPDLHAFRVVTNTGISNMRLLGVSAMPTVLEAEPNNDFSKPQLIPYNSTVDGVVLNEDVDYYAVELKAGQKLNVEVEGLRLSYLNDFFDPYIAIYDEKRFEIAASDDSVFLQQDCLAAITAPSDGKYIIEVRESSFGGNERAKYRLHIGGFPRPVAILPSGGPPGKPLETTCIDALGNTWQETFTMPAMPIETHQVWSQANGVIAPSPNFLRVQDIPNVMESEPNADHNKVETVSAIPAAFNGILESANDRDFWVFEAKKDQQLEIRVHARNPHRSQVDAMLQVWKVGGGSIAGNDDSGGPDSYLQFKVPADGKYALCVFDHLGRFGKHFVYRAEVLLQTPAVEATITEQERYVSQTVEVPRGGRMAIEVNVGRKFVGGDAKIVAKDLPPGMTQEDAMCPTDLGKVMMLFHGDAAAPNAGKLVDFKTTIQSTPETAIVGKLRQRTQMVRGQNNVDVWGRFDDRLAVALIDPVPFEMTVVQPQVPLVRNGSLALTINIKRNEGFDKPVGVRLLNPPPGVGASAVTIPGDKSTIEMPLTANNGAAIRKWPLVLMATTDVGYGPVRLASEFFQVEVAEPLFEFKFAKTVAEQGKPVDVVLGAKLKRPVEGKVEIEILGVPPGTTATNAKQVLAPEIDRLAFALQIPAETRAGNYKTIVYRGTVTSDKGVITQTNGNSEIQIDVPIAPPASTPATSVAATPATPAAPTDKPLTRLEQLRQQRGK